MECDWLTWKWNTKPMLVSRDIAISTRFESSSGQHVNMITYTVRPNGERLTCIRKVRLQIPLGATIFRCPHSILTVSSQYRFIMFISFYFSSKLWKRQHHQIQSILFFDSVTYPSLLSQAPFLLLFSLLENESGRNSSIKKGRSF